MNYFCKDCQHREVPQSIKEKFNQEIKETFINCPLYDDKFVFCFIKNLNIDWVAFINFLLKQRNLSSKEIDAIKKEGDNERRKRST